MKVETPELENVFSQVLQNVAKRVRYGFEGYWARRRAGLRVNTPHFRRARDYNSLTYPQFGFKLEGSTLKFSKIGELKLRLHRPVEEKVKTLTISRSPSGKWYAVFASEVESKPIEGRLPRGECRFRAKQPCGPIRWNINRGSEELSEVGGQVEEAASPRQQTMCGLP